MKKTLLFCLLAASLSAQAGTLLPPAAGDVSPAQLVAAPLPAGEFERQPLSFAWALDAKAGLEAPSPHRAESREYWAVVDSAQLKAGWNLDTTAPGAVVRLSPELAAKAGAAVDPGELVVSKDGRVLAAPQSFQRMATAEQLQDAGMDVPEGSAIVQLAAEHGQGRFQLQLPKAAGRYLVHVFEPASDLVLEAQAARGQWLAGDSVEVAGLLKQGDAPLAGRLQGQLLSPTGQAYPLAFADGKAQVALPLDADTSPGLWEVQLVATGQAKSGPVQREARTAIEVTRPTARFSGDYGFDAAALKVALPVEVAAEGRYEVRGTLYATGPGGTAEPVAQAHAAKWLAPGAGRLELAFGAANLPAGYGAPFELRFLELKDQTRLGTVDRRTLALREAGRPAPVRERRLER